jgi:hypothetical protein
MYGKHALTNHVLFVYISAYFPAEGGGCNQALDAVIHKPHFQAKVITECRCLIFFIFWLPNRFS